MKKSERILELMMELEKELASLPEEIAKLNGKMSEYDTVNSEMYHTLLNFNPSASESAKFVKNWKKALQERLEVKQEFQRLTAIQPELVTLLKRLTATRVAVKSKGVAKGNPFTYKTEIGVGIVEDSFDSFEERTTYPFKIAIEDFSESPLPTAKNKETKPKATKKKVLNAVKKAVKSPPSPKKAVVTGVGIVETRPLKGHPAFIEMQKEKLYVMSAEGVHLAGANWNEVYAYIHKHTLTSVFIQREARKKFSNEIERDWHCIQKETPVKRTLRNLLLTNFTNESKVRQQQIKMFEESNMISLGKYQLPGQRDQQKKSS